MIAEGAGLTTQGCELGSTLGVSAKHGSGLHKAPLSLLGLVGVAGRHAD